jgi:protein-tyrosine phosphatase
MNYIITTTHNLFPTNSTGKLYFGHFPSAETLDELKNKGVVAIWNLGAELLVELEMEEEQFETVIHSKIVDYSIPDSPKDFLADVKRVVSLLNSGKDVFVHCFGGHGRTGMALASIACLVNKASTADALALAKEHCSGPERLSQVKFIIDLFQSSSSSSS